MQRLSEFLVYIKQLRRRLDQRSSNISIQIFFFSNFLKTWSKSLLLYKLILNLLNQLIIGQVLFNFEFFS